MKYKSISTIMTTLFLMTTIMFLGNCGGGMSVSADPFTDVEDEFEAVKNTILTAGGVADIGIGRSPRRDIAKNKAKADAQKNLAQVFETSVQNLTKKFQEELGEDADTEINEAFSQAIKITTQKKLNFAMPKKTKYLQEDVDGTTMYTCYILMAIEPGVLNQSLMDELKNKNEKTYERFRASQAYDELDKAMQDYEAPEGNK